MSKCLRGIGNMHDKAPSCLEYLPEASRRTTSHNCMTASAAYEARRGEKNQNPRFLPRQKYWKVTFKSLKHHLPLCHLSFCRRQVSLTHLLQLMYGLVSFRYQLQQFPSAWYQEVFRLTAPQIASGTLKHCKARGEPCPSIMARI